MLSLGVGGDDGAGTDSMMFSESGQYPRKNVDAPAQAIAIPQLQ